MQGKAHQPPRAGGDQASRDRGRPDQLEAVHQASARQEQEDGQERDEDVDEQGRSSQNLQRNHGFAPRHGRPRRPTAPPMDSVRSSADGATNLKSSCPPSVGDVPPRVRRVEVRRRGRRRTPPAASRSRKTPACRAAEAHGGKFNSTIDLTKLRPPISFSSAPGKLYVFAVALLVAVIDVVVAEAAEEEVGKRLVAVVRREAGGAAQPDRRVAAAAGRTRDRACHGTCGTSDAVDVSPAPRTTIAAPSRRRRCPSEFRTSVKVSCASSVIQPIDIDGHILISGSRSRLPAKLPSTSSVSRRGSSKISVLGGRCRRRSLCGWSCGPEEIVEVAPCSLRTATPVVALVLAIERATRSLDGDAGRRADWRTHGAD